MRIHIHSRNGLYEVLDYNATRIILSTKEYRFFVPVSDFKAFAGGDWNWDVPAEKMETFLSVVQPEEYNKIVEQREKIPEYVEQYDDDDDDFYNYDDEIDYEDEIDYGAFDYNHVDYPNFENLYYETRDELTTLKSKMRNIAYQIYSQKLDFSEYHNDSGIKFIIQQNRQNKEDYRLKFDPYGFVSNGHSDIDDLFTRDMETYKTINGGWLKVINNIVILYAKSGDYGVYDDIIAMKCAKEVFTGKSVFSFAGKSWNDVEDMIKRLNIL